MDKVLDLNPLRYWPLWDAVGPNAEELIVGDDGTYIGAPALGQTGIGDGNTVPSFDGANNCVDIYSAAFDAVFDPTLGTFAIWAQVRNAAIWTNAITQFIAAFGFFSGTFDVIDARKGVAANTVRCAYASGGAAVDVVETPFAETDWFHVVYTWSQAANNIELFINGTTRDTDNPPAWAAGGSVPTTWCIGASDTVPNNVFDGFLGHPAVWDRVLLPAEIGDLATV